MVGRPSRCLEVVERLSRMSDKGREALPNVRELSVGLPGTFRGQPRGPEMVRTHSRMFERGRAALPYVREWWEALLDVWEWSGGPLGCPGVVRRPSQMFGSNWEALPVVRE